MKIEYFTVLAICVTAPLLLSFSKKLDFYRYPARLVLSIGIPFVIFIIWDFIVTARGHWSFNPLYTVGLNIYNLPIEEVLFFIVIPFCGIFTWECVKYFTKGRQ